MRTMNEASFLNTKRFNTSAVVVSKYIEFPYCYISKQLQSQEL